MIETMAVRPKRMVDPSPAWRPRWLCGVVVGLVVFGTGCSLDGLLNSDQLPEGVSDPAITQTPEGARAAYVGTRIQFRRAFGGDGNSFIAASGLLADELSATNSLTSLEDQRTMPEGGDGLVSRQTYSDLQKVRGQAGQAIGLLSHYLPEQPELQGHLYALEGYAEVMLAELFCSGIPLGTLDYQGDFTYRAGSRTEEVLAHAVALFDTALALSGDSVSFVQLARTGRARALLGLDRYAEAAATAAAVPGDYRYLVQYADTFSARNFASAVGSNGSISNWIYTIPDHEGTNGLDWRTSGDPRTPVMLRSPLYYPSNYTLNGTTSLVLASGVEARLIEAEAQWRAGDNAWLATLNALRTDGTYDTTATTPPDTLWHAGTGGIAGLAPLDDPGASLTGTAADSARVDLVFRERAFWLFLTGHRQGDLRRLIRQYGRFEGDVYPVGPYPGRPSPYGADVVAPIPVDEYANPLYTGCLSRDA